MRWQFSGAAICFVLGGCGFYLPSDVARPGDITLETAMKDTGKSLVAMRDELRSGQFRTGLIADEVTVTFNISANASMGNTLTLEAGQPQKAGAFLLTGLKDEFKIENTSARGNQIVVKLKNIYTITPNAIALSEWGIRQGKASAKPGAAGQAKSDKPEVGKEGQSPAENKSPPAAAGTNVAPNKADKVSDDCAPPPRRRSVDTMLRPAEKC